ncbi:MAG: DUF4019 domain-containing protein [Gemmatimonadetes bacterium]|nr:DUF4019 domain-containing protein [Gemmatimonadota bacterium]
MRLARAALLALSLALAWAAAPRAVAAQAARDTTLRAAERAAREWLWLLDEQLYEAAWARVAPAMQSVVTYQRWTTSLAQLRAVLPRVLPRELRRAERSGQLFGGEAVILSFGADAWREIVVLVRRGEAWQVGGYGILRDRGPTAVRSPPP